MKALSSLFIILFSVTAFSQTNKELKQIIDSVQSIYSSYRPESVNRSQEYFFMTVEQVHSREKLLEAQLDLLRTLDAEMLDRQDQITQATMALSLSDELSSVKYKTYLLPFNAEGGFYNSPAFSLRNRKFNSLQDYEDYALWVRSFLDYLDYNIDLMKMGMEAGIMRPQVIVKNTLSLLKPWIDKEVNESIFYSPYLRIPESITGDQKELLISQGKDLIENKVIPKYQAVYGFLESSYLPKAPKKVGIENIHSGKSYYEDRIRFYTTLELSPDSVFALGNQEVSRIRSLMVGIIEDLQFAGSFDEFIEFLRTDDQFYAKTPQELLSRAAWLSKKAEGQLPALFSLLYELPFTVEPVPMSIAPNYTGGRYVPGSRSQDRAGIYWVNTYDLPSRPFYTLPALTLHEAVPGHHLGIMVAAELTSDVPEFRKNYYISAFGEGWGLYAEYLGEEMGMYETPYELFGRYTYEMWRACRLVVDVGIHYKGWTRGEAVDFLASNTALSLHEVNTEIDRYIGWPGQAVSYKIGELTIKSLRRQAEEVLGDKFDIQKFHQVILANGSIPLSELRTEVERYIKESLVSKNE